LSDRINVGGEESGQQAVFTEPSETGNENSFEVDGVVITDMAAIGSSPPYYGFDQFEEIQVSPAPPRAKRVAPSTGGTAEPNDQPYGDVFFRGYGTNPFVDAEDDPLSTFGLDVDTGSWGVVKRFLGDGNLPPREAVRVEELVNAFDYGDPAPAEGDFRIVAEGAGTPYADRRENPRYRLLRFGLRAREVDASERRPAVLTFVVDVSGSMAREDRLGLVRRALVLLLDQLREGDRVGLVIYGSRGQVVLDHTGDLEAIRSAVGRLRPEGSTNAEEGLVLAYEAARRAYREGAINRVILCSDGVANVGRTGPASILERIGDEARGGIELTTVGFGMGNYNDVLMEQLADRGDGAYAYVDDLDEARRIFVENLTGTLQTIARDSKVQVEVDPEVVARYRLLGYENRDVPDEKFRDDTVDAGEVGAGHAVTALYELKLREGVDPDDPEDRERTAAILRLRWRSAETGRVEEVARRVTVGELAGAWDEAPASLRLASVVAEFAEALKGTYWARGSDLDELFHRAQRVSADFPGDLRAAELVTTIGRAARIPED
jgi:Ca-activated chloride channel family protein